MFESGNSSPRNEPARPSSSLSEISHLFLSGVRDKTDGSSRPQRRPPGQHAQRPANSIDLTPEEFATVFDREDAMRLDGAHDLSENDDAQSANDPQRLSAPTMQEQRDTVRQAPVSAVIAGHFGARQIERIHHYARELAADNKRIGLIEVDASEFRLFCFDGHAHSHIEHTIDGSPQRELESFDLRRMSEALAEMGWDVERWLLVLPSPRLPESKAVLRAVRDWVLLSTPDHDGVVSAYRTMKGLVEDAERDCIADGNDKPRVSLSVLDADETTAERVYRKLASVCEEFLNWHIEPEPMANAASAGARVAEHLVMACRATRDKAQAATGTQWQVVGEFLACAASDEARASEAKSVAAPVAAAPVAAPRMSISMPAEEKAPMTQIPPLACEPVESVVSAEESCHFREPLPETPSASEAPVSIPMPATAADDVIELVGDASTEAGIIASVMRQGFGAGQLVECPIAPPMRQAAKLAVARDRRITLVAVARQGLSDLRSIGQAYRWLVENRALIAMAMPQLSIDAHAMPHLNVLIDQSDTSAELLQPLLSAGHVTVRTYRKLRWGGKMGLLLEAA